MKSLVPVVALAFCSAALEAQVMPADHQMEAADSATATSISAGASGILAGTVAAPGVRDRNLAEGYLTQPMVMAQISTGKRRFVADVTLNFEGTTLDRGELSAGMYGEGYVDRRHPHTLLHEAVGTGTFGGGLTRWSLSAGKGFVPFGTDDPMSRPFIKYPVNHHLAQLLERAMVAGAFRSRAAMFEVAAFNGDEPESPFDMPNWDRFGDSWAARMTATWHAFEAQASIASVTSPEQPRGGGLDHRKLSSSVRYESDNRYFMVEWARTREVDRNVTAFRFNSLLAEGSLVWQQVKVALRAERTERPEEERLQNVFRTPRPHSDLSILGRTRWDVLTAAASRSFVVRRAISLAPFAEVSTQRPTAQEQPSVFDPRAFYGASRLWSVSAGMRIGAGMKHSRMGRYGVAVAGHAHETTLSEDHSKMDMN
jgi:hypothetical protein